MSVRNLYERRFDFYEDADSIIDNILLPNMYKLNINHINKRTGKSLHINDVLYSTEEMLRLTSGDDRPYYYGIEIKSLEVDGYLELDILDDTLSINFSTNYKTYSGHLPLLKRNINSLLKYILDTMVGRGFNIKSGRMSVNTRWETDRTQILYGQFSLAKTSRDVLH